MDDAVSDSFDLTHIFETSDFRICQRVDNNFHSNGMIGHRNLSGGFAAILFFVLNESVNTDSLADSLGENLTCCGIHQLIFQR